MKERNRLPQQNTVNNPQDNKSNQERILRRRRRLFEKESQEANESGPVEQDGSRVEEEVGRREENAGAVEQQSKQQSEQQNERQVEQREGQPETPVALDGDRSMKAGSLHAPAMEGLKELQQERLDRQPVLGEHPAALHPAKKGPQLWAVVLSLAGLYYLWTRILGRPLPGCRSANRVGGKSHHSRATPSDIRAARERQQDRLRVANRAQGMLKAANDRQVRERHAASSSSSPEQPPPASRNATPQEQHLQNQEKHRRRQLYLKHKEERDKREEIRRKDEQLGPGWRYRENPGNPIDSMDPQAGSGGGGGYKPQKCTPRG